MSLKKDKENQIILTIAHNKYEKGLNAHAQYKLNNKELSEDLVQDTFIKTWRYLVKGGKIDTMKAFLYRVLNNLVVDQYRKHKTTSLDVLIEKGFEPYSSSGKERVYDIIDGKKVVLLIERLPEKYKTIITMKYVDDMTMEEMSKDTNQSKNTIAVQIHRGLNKLKILYNLNNKK